jgi:iron(II)-dependent oxidoreductase
MREVRDRVLGLLEKEHTDELRYFVMLSVFHEDMHGEAFIYTRQTLEYPAPVGLVREGNSEGVSYQDRFDGLLVPLAEIALEEPRAKRDDVYVPGGTFMLGATAGESFVFDNEKWAHPVAVKPFAIARAVVTQGDFAAFVEGGGYQREDFWCPQGWRWRLRVNAEHPVYWRRSPAGGWLRRDFERWLPLEMSRPVIHVNWFEADAYCRWAGRCLPREAEWEMAASTEPATQGIGERKRRFPWGDESPTPRRANLDGYAFGCVDVGFLREGNSAHGCCQLIGNVWEWTADDFLPYPGFVADPYKEYSAPWFGTHKVLRGGCWATRSRLIRNTWRNFYTPDRRDVWAGFRTCALQA